MRVDLTHISVFAVGLVMLLVGCEPSSHLASTSLPDSTENRMAAAREYIEATPSDEFIESAALSISSQWEDSKRADLGRLLKKEFRQTVLEEATTTALVRHFTPDEIRALARFNSSREGRAIQKKMAGYMADVLPPLQEEVVRVLSLTHATLAQLQWEQRLVTVRLPPEEEKLIVDFAFMNHGARTVNILSVSSPCDCIQGVPDRTHFPPRHGGYIRVVFTPGPRTGLQRKYVTVQTDDPCEPSVRLQLDVSIPEVVRIDPSFAVWTTGDAADTRAHHVQVLLPGAHMENVACRDTAFEVAWQSTPAGGEVRITPCSTLTPCSSQVDVLVRVAPHVVRRFPIFLSIQSKAPASS